MLTDEKLFTALELLDDDMLNDEETVENEELVTEDTEEFVTEVRDEFALDSEASVDKLLEKELAVDVGADKLFADDEPGEEFSTELMDDGV